MEKMRFNISLSAGVSVVMASVPCFCREVCSEASFEECDPILPCVQCKPRYYCRFSRHRTHFMTMDIELISFDLCPFVQRSVITLLEKEIPFKRTNIDLANKPEWFLNISPLGKVPVLRINGNILFESAVINEYLDEITPPSMHPQDPLQKAVNRAWIEYGSELSKLSFRMLTTDDKSVVEQSLQGLRDKFEFLDKNLTAQPFFNGAAFSLIDAAYAPVFIRIEYLLRQVIDGVVPRGCSKVLAWSDAVLARPSVQGSIIDRFTELATERFRKRGGILLQGL